MADPRIPVSRTLLEDLVDPGDCVRDLHGGCQAHGYLGLSFVEVCPQAKLKEILADG